VFYGFNIFLRRIFTTFLRQLYGFFLRNDSFMVLLFALLVSLSDTLLDAGLRLPGQILAVDNMQTYHHLEFGWQPNFGWPSSDVGGVDA
jgi:hypothetical protein